MIKTITIRTGTVEEAVEVSQQIPEFECPYDYGEYAKRLEGVNHLVAVAECDGKVVGFKVAYQRETNESLYSWIGGVLPSFRSQGIAKQLAAFQEEWARNYGFTSIKMKTRNWLKPMLHFAIDNDFNIIAIENNENVAETRIWLEKQL